MSYGGNYFLKQSTAVTIKAGPFVDEADGFTEEVGLTISQADIRLSKAGGDFAQSNNAAGATHDENGYYDVPLDTTDTDTVGPLTVAIPEGGARPVRHDFFVLPANVYNSLLGTDKLQVHADEITNDLITAAAIATGAIDADALAADAITAEKVAADVHAEAADAIWDEARSGHTTAGTFGQGVASVQGNVTGSVAGSVASVTAKVTPVDVDGLTFVSLMEAMMAVAAGVATRSGSTISFKKRDGTTTKIQITVGATQGERTASVIS